MHIETLGSGPDLVLIHGWAMHGGVFAPLLRELSAHFECHVVDLPGHGLSEERDGLFKDSKGREFALFMEQRIVVQGGEGEYADIENWSRAQSK